MSLILASCHIHAHIYLCQSLEWSNELGVFDLDVRQLSNSVLPVHDHLAVSGCLLTFSDLLLCYNKYSNKHNITLHTHTHICIIIWPPTSVYLIPSLPAPPPPTPTLNTHTILLFSCSGLISRGKEGKCQMLQFTSHLSLIPLPMKFSTPSPMPEPEIYLTGTQKKKKKDFHM